LDFHHIKDKKFNIAEVSRYGPKVIQEINKCTILCAVCHRMETCGNLDVSTFKNCNLDEKGNIVP
jgi:hypothetical protein